MSAPQFNPGTTYSLNTIDQALEQSVTLNNNIQAALAGLQSATSAAEATQYVNTLADIASGKDPQYSLITSQPSWAANAATMQAATQQLTSSMGFGIYDNMGGGGTNSFSTWTPYGSSPSTSVSATIDAFYQDDIWVGTSTSGPPTLTAAQEHQIWLDADAASFPWVSPSGIGTVSGTISGTSLTYTATYNPNVPSFTITFSGPPSAFGVTDYTTAVNATLAAFKGL